MNAVGHRVVLKGYQLMPLILVDVDHVRRSKVRGMPIDGHAELPFGQQSQVIELVRVAMLDVASILEVHLTGPKIGYTAKSNFRRVHAFPSATS